MNDIREVDKRNNKKKKDWGRITYLVIAIISFALLIFSFTGRPFIGFHKCTILESCSGNLRNMGIIITNYYKDHKKHYPQNLKVMIEQGYLETLPTCPNSDKNYILQINGWDDDDLTVWCPNPEIHGYNYNRNDIINLYFYSREGELLGDKHGVFCIEVEEHIFWKIKRNTLVVLIFILIPIGFIFLSYWNKKKQKISIYISTPILIPALIFSPSTFKLI